MATTTYTKYEAGSLPIGLAYLLIFGFWLSAGIIEQPVSVNMIITSTLLVLVGSHKSLALLQKGKDGKRLVEADSITSDDAKKFPLIASCSLFGLGLAFKYFDKDSVNLVLSCYIGCAGLYTLVATLSPIVSMIVPSIKENEFYAKFKLPFTDAFEINFSWSDIVSTIASAIFCYFYFTTKHFMLNNIFGISFCIQGIEKISIGSYTNGAILLCGLFFYDIFWVFGTDVMVTVAKSFDGPIKLLFPRSLPEMFMANPPCSLLGLGDIVIPGLFVALLLRFDCYLAKADPKTAASVSFSKPFFTVNIISYAGGLVTTVAVMYFFEAAQPALLYLVPFTLISSALTGMISGKFNALLEYNEEELDDDNDGDGDEKKKDK